MAEVTSESTFLLTVLLEYFDAQATLMLTDGVSLFRANLGIPLLTIVNVTVAIFGFSLLTGGLPNMGWGDVMSYFVKLNIVCAMFLNIDVLVLWGYKLITEMPILWSASVMSASRSGLTEMPVYQQLDQIYLHGVKHAIELASTWSPSKLLLAVALFLASTAMFVMTLVLLLGHKIILILMLIISPLFVALLLFKKTSGLTEAWLKQLLASTLTIFLVLMMVVIIIQLGMNVGDDHQFTDTQTASILKSIIMMTIGTYFISEVPGIARQISGGVSIESGLYGLSTVGSAVTGARNSRQRWLASRDRAGRS